MKNYFVKKSCLDGEIEAPRSKSQSIRAILFASIARGKSKIKNFLKSKDVFTFIEGCKKFRAKILIKKNNLEIIGTNKILFKKNEKFNANNSGLSYRLLCSIYALCDRKITVTGDKSILENRYMQPLIDALNTMQANVKSIKNNGFAPLEIQGPLSSGHVKIDGEDSQFISSLLIASSLLKGKTQIDVKNAKEKPWINLTLSWLDKFNVAYVNENFQKFTVFGNNRFKAFDYEVPSDFSSILFPIVAALITKSKIVIKNIVFDDFQNDQKTIDVLIKKFNANITINRQDNKIIVEKSSLKGSLEIDMDDFIDSLPILAVFGCYNEGKIILKNASSAKKKESNRIFAICSELKKMNAKIVELNDGVSIEKSNLKKAKVKSFNDHRIAISLTIAALGIDGVSVIEDINCIDKTYPTFKMDMKSLKARIL